MFSRCYLLSCRIAALAAIISSVIGLASCTTAPAGSGVATDLLVTVPPDFLLDVLVLSNSETAQSARYVVFTDGSLHAARGDGAHADVLPPTVRVLSRRDLADLWSMLGQLGYAASDSGEPPVNPALVQPLRGETVHLVTLTANNHSRFFEASAMADRQPDPAASTLTAHLNRLAWMDGDDEASTFVQPQRYDFGPDPYVQYRQPTVSPEKP